MDRSAGSGTGGRGNLRNGSGNLSPDSAAAQAARVSKARGITIDRVNQLVAQLTEGPELGVLGEPPGQRSEFKPDSG